MARNSGGSVILISILSFACGIGAGLLIGMNVTALQPKKHSKIESQILEFLPPSERNHEGIKRFLERGDKWMEWRKKQFKEIEENERK